jgi:hypothetical protein
MGHIQTSISLLDHTSREQLYASIDIMEESIAARGATPGHTISEGAGDGAWLRPRHTFHPHF